MPTIRHLGNDDLFVMELDGELLRNWLTGEVVFDPTSWDDLEILGDAGISPPSTSGAEEPIWRYQTDQTEGELWHVFSMTMPGASSAACHVSFSMHGTSWQFRCHNASGGGRVTSDLASKINEVLGEAEEKVTSSALD